MKFINSKTFKIVGCCALIVAIIATLIVLTNNQFNKNNTIGKNVEDNEAVKLIKQFETGLNKRLNIDEEDAVGVVGDMNGERVYAFNTFSYSGVVKGNERFAEEEVVEKALLYRRFNVFRNNVVFQRNEDTYVAKKMFDMDNAEFLELSMDEVTDNYPETREDIEQFIENRFFEISFYKVNLNYNEKTKHKQYNIIYIIGKNDEIMKILKTIFFVDGEKERDHIEIRLKPNDIENFKPLELKEDSTVGNVRRQKDADLILEETKVYNGSLPYGEQDFEANNKMFEDVDKTKGE